MATFYRNQGYEEESHHADFYNSRGFRSHSHHPNYPDALNSPDYPEVENNLGFRNHQEFPDFHTNPAFSRSQRTPDYPDSTKNSYHSRTRHNPDSSFLAILDYPEAEDFWDTREDPDDAGSGNNTYGSSSKNYPHRPGSLRIPDHMGARDYLSPKNRNNQNYPSSLGIPDYPGAEDNLSATDNWGSAYNWDRQNNHDYSYSENLEMGRGAGNKGHHSGLFHRTSGSSGRGNLNYPESFQMISRQPTHLHSKHPVPDPDGGGYRNTAYEDESSLDGDYGNQHLEGEGEHVGDFFRKRKEQKFVEKRPEGIKHNDHAVEVLVNVEDLRTASRMSSWPSSSQNKLQENIVDLEDMDVDMTEAMPPKVSASRKGNRLSRISNSISLSFSQALHIRDHPNDSLTNPLVNSLWRRNWHEVSQQAYDPAFVTLANKTKHKEKLISSLINLSVNDRGKIIRNQPLTIQEKREIKKRVHLEKQKSSDSTVELNCCTSCLTAITLYYRHFKSTISEFFQFLQIWQRTLKIIGSKFGTSVLSYFNFLTWLLNFNIFSSIVNFSFITIPQFIESKPNTLSFTGLEFLTGAGYFQETVMYYGFYTNSTIKHKGWSSSYNMQLAYIFTIGLYLVICFFSLLYSMASSFRNNFINPHIYSRGTAKLVFSWDFTITHEKAVKLKQRNLSTELKENLSEIRHENVITPLKQRLSHLCIHLVAWIISTGVAVACCVAVYYLASNNLKFLKEHKSQAATLLLPFVVCCINLFIPLFYSTFGLVEKFEIPRRQVLVIIIRNILLKISIIGILCYYWLNFIAESNEECWETHVGQDIYRLLIMNFLFTLFDSIFREFLRRIIGTKLITVLSMPEFDIASNVLELIYTQTLLWIGIFFAPLLPFIHTITLFITFYVKRVSLMMNCQPPSKAWRASQMMTLFIFLLFFPSFTGVLCVLAITVWRLKPSAECGPFQGLPSIIHAIYGWIEILSNRPSYLWVVWIYRNLIGSVHFFFILTVIVLIITYLYWQIIEGRKIMIKLLHEQIINEGKDKMFLLEKLLKLQESQKKTSTFSLAQGMREQEIESRQSLDKSTDLPRRSRSSADLASRSRISLTNPSSAVLEDHYFNNDTRQPVGLIDEDSSEAFRVATRGGETTVRNGEMMEI